MDHPRWLILALIGRINIGSERLCGITFFTSCTWGRSHPKGHSKPSSNTWPT